MDQQMIAWATTAWACNAAAAMLYPLSDASNPSDRRAVFAKTGVSRQAGAGGGVGPAAARA
jgi:hypothetical protein